MNKQILNALVVVVSDAVAVTMALLLGHWQRAWLEQFTLFSNYDGDWRRFAFSGFLYAFLVLVFFASGLYARRNDFWEETRKIFQGVFFLFILVVIYLFATKTATHYSRTMVGLMFVNMAWLLPLFRIVTKRSLYRLGVWQIPALIVGAPEQVEKLLDALRANWYLGYEPRRETEREGIVFIATKGMPVERLEALIHQYKQRFHDVIIIPYLHDLSFANAEIIDLRIGQISMINLQNQLFRRRNLVLKRLFESLVVLALLPPFAICYVFIAVWIRLDSPGSVLFRQKRLGKNGQVFDCFKFRTMHENSEALLQAYLTEHPEEVAYYEIYHKYRNDPRITGAGRWLRKFSLDELPQVFNILRGQMNLIGPRPYTTTEKEKLASDAETILHVRPGLTGFWQIKGRNELSFSERVRLDVWYIQNWSLWLDFIIFVKTFEVLITRRGAR